MEVAFAFAQARFGLRPRVESLQVCHFWFALIIFASQKWDYSLSGGPLGVSPADVVG